MSFSTTTNLVTIILCIAVLVQTWRVMNRLTELKAVDLPAMAKALDLATGQAKTVLSELRAVLKDDAGPNIRTLSEARAIRDELGVMVGIANATADRLLENAAAARSERADADEEMVA